MGFRYRLYFLLILQIWIGGLLVFDCVASEEINASKVKLYMAVQDDRFVVDKIDISLSERFRRLAPDVSEQEISMTINDFIVNGINLNLPLFAWALTDKDVIRYLNDDQSNEYSSMSIKGKMTWTEAQQFFINLNRTHKIDHYTFLEDILDRLISSDLFSGPKGILSTTPLSISQDWDNVEDAKKGVVKLTLSDPVSDDDYLPERISFSNTSSAYGFSNKTLYLVSKPKDKIFWWKRQIVTNLVDYYAKHGISVHEPPHYITMLNSAKKMIRDKNLKDEERIPKNIISGRWNESFPSEQIFEVSTVVADFSTDEPRKIDIREPAFITTIYAPKTTDKELLQTYYSILSSNDFAVFVNKGGPKLLDEPTGGTPGPSQIVFLKLDKVQNDKWALRQTAISQRARLLTALGYTYTLGEADDSGSSIIIGKAVESDPGKSVDSTKKNELKDYRNNLGLSAGYAPGQGFSSAITYKRLLLDDKTADIQASIGQFDFQDAYGEFSVDKDFLFFGEKFQKRLRVGVKGYSQIEPNLEIAGTNTDERRSGVSLKGTIDLARDVSGNWLNLSTSILREKVELKPENNPRRASYHDRVELSSSWFISQPLLHIIDWLRFEPSAILSVGSGKKYINLQAHAGSRIFLPWFLEYNIRVTTAHATSNTPVEDQPRIGGEDSVRGFRNGAANGKTIWAVQNEVWMPLRLLDNATPQWLEKILPNIRSAFRQNIFLACFSDIGGIYGAQFGDTWIVGAGLGLRFRMNQDTSFKLDWGHGFKTSNNIKGGDRVHFNITVDFPM